MWDLRAATNSSSFSADNITGGLPALTGANGTQLVSVDPVTGAEFASDDVIDLTASGDFAIYVLMRKDVTDTDGYFSDAAWPNRVRYTDGVTYLATGIDVRFYANGVFGAPYSTRDALHDALDDDEFHAVKLGPMTLSGLLPIGRNGNGIEADIVAVVAIDLSEVTDQQATEALIANWFNEISPSYAPPPPPPPPGSAKDALEADFAGRTNSGMWDLRAATNSSSFSADNITGGLPALTGANGTQLVSVDPVTGAEFASDDVIDLTASGDFAIYVLMRKDVTDTDGYFSDAAWPNRVRYTDGVTYLATGIDVRFYANGVFGAPYSTRDALHDALDDDEFHAVKLGPMTLSGLLPIGRNGNGIEADIVAVVAIDLSEVTDQQATEALIANWFNEISPS